MLTKNQIVPLTIESITNQGSGVGHYDGIAIFVPLSAVGDQLRVRIVKVMHSYCYGIIETILVPSTDRCAVDCSAFRRCGGCTLRHIRYDAELKSKESWVRDALQRLGGFTLDPELILPSPLENGYRNKAQYPFGQDERGIFCGFFAPHSHRTVRCKGCPLQPEVFTQIADTVCAFLDRNRISVYDEEHGNGLMRHLYLRRAEVTGEIMVCFVVNGNRFPEQEALCRQLVQAYPKIQSIVLNCNKRNTNVILGEHNTVLYGRETITDQLCGIPVDLSPHSFYQVNHDGAEQLYNCASEMADLQTSDLLLDLYCGTGTIGLSMASRIRRLIGVEIIESAVDNARVNAHRAGIHNAEFLCADAAAAAVRLAAEGLRPNLIIMDPPRKGCDAATLEAAIQMAPQRIVMVSCNPATLARDAKFLCERGYCLKRARPVDMFPRTAHVECVALLEK